MGKKRNRKYQPEFFSHDLNFDTYDFLNKLCPNKTYCVVLPSEKFKDILPERFVDKTNAAVILHSEASGSAVFAVNFNRKDVKSSGSYIDLHTYIIAYDLSGSICRGGFIEHADYPHRSTEYTDSVLWSMVSGSAVLDHLPIAELPAKQSGLLSELPQPQNDAYKDALKRLIDHFNNGKNNL
jgi:hypothetical protein